MNSEPDTRANLQTVLAAVNNLQQENLQQEMNARFIQHDEHFEQMCLELMSFDTRIDRWQATAHENLNIAYNLRAGVKNLREEVSS